MTSHTTSKAGTLILSITTPYVHNVTLSKRKEVCNQCLLPSACLTRCTKCNMAYYCSSSCQELGKELHRVECALLQYRLDNIHDDYLMFIKLCQRWSNGKAQKIKDEAGLRTFSQLNAHLDSVQKNNFFMGRFTEMMNVLHSIPKQHMNVVIPSYSDALQIFARMIQNVFQIKDDIMAIIGSGIYLIASDLQRSCDPNGSILFRGSQLRLYLNRDVKFPKEAMDIPDNLKFVQVMFFPQYTIREQRLVQLREYKGISCSCERCKAHGNSYTELECFCPSGLCCGGIVRSQSTEMQRLKCDKRGWLSRSDCIVVSHQLKKAAAAEKEFQLLSTMKERTVVNSYAILQDLLLNFRLATSKNMIRASLLDMVTREALSCYHYDEALYYCHLLLSYHEHGNPTSFPLGRCYCLMADILELAKGLHPPVTELYRKSHAILSLYWSEEYTQIQYLKKRI